MPITLPIFQVDAFSSGPFTGNPAAVCPLTEWLPDHLMQSIAAENNVSDTAFVVPVGPDFHIRWFTPTVEVDLCGHATLAAAFILFRSMPETVHSIRLQSRSGWLGVTRAEDRSLTLDFPADPVQPVIDIPTDLLEGLNVALEGVYRGRYDLLVRVADDATVRALKPDMHRLAKLPVRGIIVTAPGDDCDVVSRFFGPACGVDEDPVTGSAHCTLASYWSASIHLDRFSARQRSTRGGWLQCALVGNRVMISGQCHLFLEGVITI